MPLSPIQRSTRRTLPAFAHPPSRLSKSTTTEDLSNEPDDDEDEDHESDASPSKTAPNGKINTPKATQKTPAPVRTSRSSQHTKPSTPITPQYHPPTVGSSTPTVHTPIHYSPFATSTPPAPLSKSASVPFDLAGSARAARHANEERRRTLAGSTPQAVGSPIPFTDGLKEKKKRFVRRKSLFERLNQYPGYIIDQIQFYSPTSIEDVLPPAHLANPIALGIHCLHFLLVAPLWTAQDEAYSILRSSDSPSGAEGRWNRWEEEQRDIRKGLLGAWTNFIVTAILLGLAIGNSIYLFTRFRTYDMQLRNAQDPITSPHASPIEAPHRTPQEEGDSPSQQETGGNALTRIRTVLRFSWVVIKWIYAAIMSALGRRAKEHETMSMGNEDSIQSLKVWDPPEFSLQFFCAYPPSSPLLTRLLTPLHPLLTPILHLTSSILLHHLASSYAQLVKDRMVLSAEVMKEYDRRFVYKRIFSTRVDRSTQTNEAEMVF